MVIKYFISLQLILTLVSGTLLNASVPGAQGIEASLLTKNSTSLPAEMSGMTGQSKASSLLSIDLVNFIASETEEGIIELTWQLSNNSDIRKFEIYHCTEQGQWELLACKKVCDTSSNNIYTYTHNGPAKAANYYRIKLVRSDSSFTYSQPLYIYGMNVKSDFQVFPNPSTGILYIMDDSSENSPVMLIDERGKKTIIKTGIVTNSKCVVDLTFLPKGIYYLSIRDKLQKIIIQ